MPCGGIVGTSADAGGVGAIKDEAEAAAAGEDGMPIDEPEYPAGEALDILGVPLIPPSGVEGVRPPLGAPLGMGWYVPCVMPDAPVDGIDGIPPEGAISVVLMPPGAEDDIVVPCRPVAWRGFMDMVVGVALEGVVVDAVIPCAP